MCGEHFKSKLNVKDVEVKLTHYLKITLVPACSWDRKNNPEPWNKLGPNDQYKVIYLFIYFDHDRKNKTNFKWIAL